MQFKDYYKVLGVEPGADAATIKSAYRRLAKKYHPDKSSEAGAEDRFKEINEANEVLGDPARKAEYDQLRAGGFRSGEEFRPPPGWQGGQFDFGDGPRGDFSDFFESLFGRGRGGGGRAHGPSVRRRGPDLRATLEVDLATAAEGGKQRFQVGGTRGLRTLEVRIPAGVQEGQTIRLAEQGEPGPDGAGDLLLEIHIRPHPDFEVDGRDLRHRLALAPWEAALGAQLAVPTLSGQVSLRVPSGSRSGQRLRLKGKGLPGTPAGDLYVELQIQAPPAANEADRQWYEQMQERFADFEPRRRT
ncbi:MAG: DnaJ domain-containing protein [Xanthomonadales bacterium]|nr:DnaJ domain-containing protein [Xanthomonadales bacterium]